MMDVKDDEWAGSGAESINVPISRVSQVEVGILVDASCSPISFAQHASNPLIYSK